MRQLKPAEVARLRSFGAIWAARSWRLRGEGARGLMSERGQAFLRELRGVLAAMEEKRLARGWRDCEGRTCAVAAVLAARGEGISVFGSMSAKRAARVLGLPLGVVKRVIRVNDSGGPGESGELRFGMVSQWVEASIRPQRA